MWCEFIQGYTSRCLFSEPASLNGIAEVEQSLRVALPNDLKTLLEEANGASVDLAIAGGEEPCEVSLFWSTQEILEENRLYRSFDAEEAQRIDPFTSLLFFASMPNGDPIAFQVTDGTIIEPTIIAMSHEDWADRRLVAASLRDYLAWFLNVAAKLETDMKHNSE